MEVKEIFAKIKYKKFDIEKNNITLPNTKEKINVKGFGICENDNYAKGSYRYYLEFNIDKPLEEKNTLVSILMNPSDKTYPPNNIDGTIQNVIKMAYIVGYSKVIILNSFALIQSNGKNAIASYSENTQEELNRDFIKKFINQNKDKMDCLCAWGEKSNISDITIINEFKQKFIYDCTKKNYPKHASPYNNKAINKFIEKNKKEFKPIEKINERGAIIP